MSIQGCTESQPYYFLYRPEDGILKKDTIGSILSYSLLKPVYTNWDDSMKIEISSKGYYLMHNLKGDKKNPRDTFMMKPISFLDSVDYYDSSWFGKEINIKNFWDPTQYFNDGISDSLKIYVIEPRLGNDSVIIRRAHRFFMPGREG